MLMIQFYKVEGMIASILWWFHVHAKKCVFAKNNVRVSASDVLLPNNSLLENNVQSLNAFFKNLYRWEHNVRSHSVVA